MERYYQPEIETASREQIKAWQDERLVKQVKHVWDNVPYYRKKMEEKGVTPADIKSSDDLYKLPFVSKADLREAYPYGLVGMPLKDCVRIQSTSGTTGKRVVAFYTQHDIDLWEDCCARAIVAAGGTDEDVCQVSYGYGLCCERFICLDQIKVRDLVACLLHNLSGRSHRTYTHDRRIHTAKSTCNKCSHRLNT